MTIKNVFLNIFLKFILFVLCGFGIFFLVFFAYYFYQIKFGDTEKINKINANFSAVSQNQETDFQTTEIKNWENLINNYNPKKGEDNSQIKIIAFMDFECSYCKQDYKKILDIQEKFPISQIIFKYTPILNGTENLSYKTALASACANEQGYFWEYYEKLFTNENHTQNNLFQIASDLGLDTENFQNCFNSETYKNQINQDLKDFSDYNFRGTPTYLINGYILEGVQAEKNWTEKILQLINN